MKRRSFWVTVLLSALVSSLALTQLQAAVPAASSAPSLAQGKRPNLLLITLDTTRADHLGSYGYRLGATPRLDRLGKEGVVVEAALAVTPLTLPSHCSLMTGLYPPRHGVRDNADFRLPDAETTLAELLLRAGYRTEAVVGSIVLSGALGISQGFQGYDEPKPAEAVAGKEIAFQEILERRAGEVTDRALARLAAVGDDPFFLWVHYFDPHSSYDPPEPFRTRFSSRLYDGEIAYVDQQIGRLLDRLSAQNKLDSTLVVVTADHGESLGEHGEATHGVFIYDATMRVPLLLRWPTQLHAGTRYKPVVSGVDLAPTLLDLFGLPPFPQGQGKSHASALRGGARVEREPVYLETLLPARAYGWAPLFGLRDATHKYIQAPSPELFDLTTDPRETNNTLSKPSPQAAFWSQRLDAVQRAMGSPNPTASEPADAERLERLKSLGYVSGGPGAPVDPPSGGPDPKQMIAITSQVDQARQLLTSRRVLDAMRLAEAVLKLDPANPAAHGVLGMALSLKGERVRGLSSLQTAAKLAPKTFEHQRNLGVALQQLGRAAEAIVAFRAALAIQPQSAPTRFSLGAALLSAGDAQAAVVELQAAIRQGYATVGARCALAAAFERSGSPDEAQTVLRAIVAKEPRAIDAWLQLAALLQRRGLREEAAVCYRRAYEQLKVERASNDPLLRVVHAQVLLLDGDSNAAIRQLEAVLGEKNLPPDVAELARRLLRTARP